MPSFVFLFGILFDLYLVSYPCKGAISIVNGGNIRYALPGENVTIEWSLGTPSTNAQVRLWSFTATKRETIARIFDDEKETIPTSSLSGVEVKKPATLILNNVSEGYNGTYRFHFNDKSGILQISLVSLFIAAKPTVTINCSSPTTVNEGNDVRCLCKGEGGNPPANVTWYKDGEQIGVTGNEERMLTLSNVGKTDSGTYKCVAQSYTIKREKSIEIFVYYTVPPTVVSFTSTPEKATIGKTVVITCEAVSVPVPSYTIIHNNTEMVSTEKTYIINVVKYSYVGSYKCIAKNKVGNSSKNYHLSVVATRTTPAPNTMVYATEKAACSTSKSGTEWYIVVATLLSGIIIGILVSYIFVCSRRQLRNRKPQSKPETETSKGNSIYEDLDLSKINSEDNNYQSLRVNSGTSVADYENQNDSTYTELNKMRDLEDNYQSLT